MEIKDNRSQKAGHLRSLLREVSDPDSSITQKLFFGFLGGSLKQSIAAVLQFSSSLTVFYAGSKTSKQPTWGG